MVYSNCVQSMASIVRAMDKLGIRFGSPEEEKMAEIRAKPRFKYLNYTEFTPRQGDIVVKQVSSHRLDSFH